MKFIVISIYITLVQINTYITFCLTVLFSVRITDRLVLHMCVIAGAQLNFLVHGQVTIIFVMSVCLFVQEFFSAVFDPILIKLGHTLYVWV